MRELLPSLAEQLHHVYLIEGNVKYSMEYLKEYFYDKFGISDLYQSIDVTIKESSDIGVEEIKEIVRGISVKPYGKWKIYIFLHAENLTVSSQNALLKTLEEVPEYAYFLFLTSNRLSLLETVRSRCILIYGGSYAQVENIEKSEYTKEFFKFIMEKDILSLERFSHKYLKDRQVAIDVLDRIEYHVLENLKKSYVGSDTSENIDSQIYRYQWILLFDEAVKAKRHLEANVNVGSCIDTMILKMLEVLN